MSMTMNDVIAALVAEGKTDAEISRMMATAIDKERTAIREKERLEAEAKEAKAIQRKEAEELACHMVDYVDKYVSKTPTDEAKRATAIKIVTEFIIGFDPTESGADKFSTKFDLPSGGKGSFSVDRHSSFDKALRDMIMRDGLSLNFEAKEDKPAPTPTEAGAKAKDSNKELEKLFSKIFPF